jgi:dTDP-glucose pyrophosphorylase
MDNRRDTTIILCGGPINYTNLPIGTNLSNAMIPVNGKPVIGWILDDLLAKGIQNDLRIIYRAQDHRLKSFTQRAYQSRLDVHLIPLQESGTIVESLHAAIENSLLGKIVRVVLGDTLIKDSYDGGGDYVYIGQVNSSRRWCLAVVDAQGKIQDYHDKEELPTGEYLALAGYYQFCHGNDLRECVQVCVEENEKELSDVLRRYGDRHPIYARIAETWFDFGNIDNLIDARQRLLSTRYFNSLHVNPILNTITKVSERDQTLTDELDWYLKIPEELTVLAPRILSHKRVNGNLQVVQEYYGYPTLAELYVYSDLHADTWVSILRHLFAIHNEFRKYPKKLAPDQVNNMYAQKTWERIEMLANQGEYWREILEEPHISYNGTSLLGINHLRNLVDAWSEKLAHNTKGCIIHGDFCFSNILHDINNQIIRLIDPRGRFGEKGIYGDPRYDIAKLRHSISGFYDFIVADMFTLTEHVGDFSGQVFVEPLQNSLPDSFDRLVIETGYDLDEIKFIEGLLFISMLPLHEGHLQRQQMMFLTGLSLLNEVLCESQSISTEQFAQ